MVLHERKIKENEILYSYRFISFTLSLRSPILLKPDRENHMKLTRNSNFIIVTNSNKFYEKSFFLFTDSSIQTNPLQHHITP